MDEKSNRRGRTLPVMPSDDWPLVSGPGPDCEHPQRLCLAPRESCPHALSWLIGPGGYHPTRCGRETDGQPMSAADIGRIMGWSRQQARIFIDRAIDKLRGEVPISWRGEWAAVEE